jgi:hypothetical protein
MIGPKGLDSPMVLGRRTQSISHRIALSSPHNVDNQPVTLVHSEQRQPKRKRGNDDILPNQE